MGAKALRRDWGGHGAAAGAGVRGGRGERCQRDYKGVKSCRQTARRTLVRRPQRQGGAAEQRVAAEEVFERGLAPQEVSFGEVPASRGLLHAAMGGVGEPGGGPAQLGATLPTFRWEQIRPHNLPGDKWLVIERRVYDISRWAQRHPGGSRLIGHHGAEDATVRPPTAGGVEPSARWGLLVGTVPCSTGGALASFLLSLTFDLPAGDPELGSTSRGLMWSRETTSAWRTHTPGSGPGLGWSRSVRGGRGSQRWVCHGRKHWPLVRGLPDALRFLLSVLALPDQALHAERLLDARGRAGSPGAGKDVPAIRGWRLGSKA